MKKPEVKTKKPVIKAKKSAVKLPAALPPPKRGPTRRPVDVPRGDSSWNPSDRALLLIMCLLIIGAGALGLLVMAGWRWLRFLWWTRHGIVRDSIDTVGYMADTIVHAQRLRPFVLLGALRPLTRRSQRTGNLEDLEKVLEGLERQLAAIERPNRPPAPRVPTSL